MDCSDSDNLSDDFVKSKNGSKFTAGEDDSSDDQIKSAVKFTCKFCKIAFTFKSNCTRHEKTCNANPEKCPARFTCQKCNQAFYRNHHLKMHLKKCSNIPPTQKKSKTPCFIKNCEAKFFMKTQLLEHLSVAHQDQIAIKQMESITFSSWDEFEAWKFKEEEATFSYFSKRRGDAPNKIRHFYCQHDGSGKWSSKRKTSRVNRKGRVKVGHYCIAKMKVTLDGEKICCEYYPTHSHACKREDMLHHPLPAAMSKFIDEKIAENIPPTVVYELVKERFLPKNNVEVHDTRSSILTKKRILERGRRRRMARRLHKDDAKAVYLMVNRLLENENSVLIYKPYGEALVYGPEGINDLPDSHDLFMFAFQTERQLELMKRHCSKILVVDETHSTNQYKYQLLSVMVVDENRRGWPVAHLITSKSDGDTLKYFFESLNSRLDNEVSIDCVITDDDPALINGMESGFSKKLTHLLCKWHVFRNLKDQLRHKAPTLFDTMLSEMKVIMNAESETLFLKLKDGFNAKYSKHPNALKYVAYLNKYYWERAEKWAMCYRNFPHGEVNTTGHIESFHNRLKKVYLKRKVNKRLDDLINILYDLEWDDFCARMREASIGFSVQPQHIIDRHQRGLLMEDDMVVEQTDKLWEVKSASGSSVTYIVERCKETCELDLCYSKCTKGECHGLCAHLFSCSCPDHHPLCKHIHKVQSLLTRGVPFFPVGNEEFYTFENPKTAEELNIEYDAPSHQDETSAHDRKRRIIVERLLSNVTLLQQFVSAAQENAVTDHSLIHVDAVLSDLVLGLESSMVKHKKDVSTVPSMKPAESYAPNEKLKTQISQLSSFKRPPKKKRKDDPAVLAAKKKAAIDDLLTCTLIENSSDSENDANQVINVNPCFTLPSTYVADPFDWVLRCGQDKISLVHLKSLEEHLLDGEEEMFRRRDPIFVRGWFYCTIVNAFFFKLSQKYDGIFSLSSDHASRASRRISNVCYLSRFSEGLRTKNIIFCPVNFGNHWCIVAVFIKECEIRFYDPMQAPLTTICLALLTQMVDDLKKIFPTCSLWKIKIVQKPKQTDSISCGPLICQFALQSVDSSLFFPSTYEVRKYVYQLIVGKCLKRSCFALEQCGSCGVNYSDDHDLLKTWICCSSCEQWFHESCVVYSSDNVNGIPFVCQ